MSIVLKNQVEASEKSADELASHLQCAHEKAMMCHEVEALMESVTDIFADMNRFVERWQEDIERGKPHDEHAGREMYDLYVRLEKTAIRTSEFGQKLEGWGFQLAGKKQFLNDWRKLKGLVSISPERVAESFAQIRRGETRSLGEFADELSRDLDSHCV
jgi:hypothetical protein